eukprot:g58917.t1
MGGLLPPWVLVLILWLPATCWARHEKQTTRDEMLKLLPYRENSLSQFAPTLFSAFPRRTGVSSFGVIRPDDFKGSEWMVWWVGYADVEEGTQAYDYIFGIMGGVVTVCLALAFAVIASCSTFIALRSICNSCGGRQVKPVGMKYTRFSVLIFRFCTSFIAIVAFLLCGMTFFANVGISHGVNHVFSDMEAFEFYVWELSYPFVDLNAKALQGATIAELLVKNFETYLYNADGNFISVETACINSASDTFKLQSYVEQTLMGSSRALNATQLSQTNTTLRTLRLALVNWPDAANISSDMSTLQSSVDVTLSPLLQTLVPHVQAMDSVIFSMKPKVDQSVAFLSRLPNNETTMKAGSLSSGLSSVQSFLDLAGLVKPAAHTLSTGIGVSSQDTTDIIIFRNNLSSMPQTASDLGDLKSDVDSLHSDISFLLPILSSVSAEILGTLYAGPSTNGDLNTVVAKLSQLEAYTVGTGTIISACNSADSALSGFPNVTSVAAMLRAQPFAAGATLASNVSDLSTALEQADIGCVDDLLTQLQGLNGSILDLPNILQNFKTKRLLVQDQRASQDDILSRLNASLHKLKALDAKVAQLQWNVVTTKIGTLGALWGSLDFGSLAAEIQSFATLLNISKRNPNGWDPTLKGLLNATDIDFQSGLATTQSTLQSYLTQLNALSVALSGQISLLQQFEGARAKLLQCNGCPYSPNMLTYAINQGSLCCTGPLQADLVAALNNVSTKLNALNLSSLQPLMTNMNVAIPHSDIADLQVRMTSLSSAVTGVDVNLGGLGSVSDVLTDLQNGLLAVAPDAALVSEADTAVSQIPDLAAVQAQLSALPPLSGFLANYSKILPDSSNYLKDDERAEAAAFLQSLEQLAPVVDEWKFLAFKLRRSSDSLEAGYGNFSKARLDFDAKKNDMWNNLDEWDMLRLIIVDLVIALPVVFTLAAVWGCIRRKGGPAMFMAILFFGVIPFFLFVASILAPTATVLADSCKDIDGFVRLQATAANMDAREFQNATGLPVTEDVDFGLAFDYFTTCQGQRPEFLTVARDSVRHMKVYGYNFSRYGQHFATAGVTLSNDTLQQFILMDNLVLQAGAAVDRALDEILLCERVIQVYDPLTSTMCGEFAGGLALCTALYMAFALCLIPGIFVGIKGYKHFPKKNEMTEEEELMERVKKDAQKQKKGGEEGAGEGVPIMAADPSNDVNLELENLDQPVAKSAQGAPKKPKPPPDDVIVARAQSVAAEAAQQQPVVQRQLNAPKLWKCQSCTFMNQPVVKLCQMCFTPREDAPMAREGATPPSMAPPSPSSHLPPGAVATPGGAVILPAGHYHGAF